MWETSDRFHTLEVALQLDQLSDVIEFLQIGGSPGQGNIVVEPGSNRWQKKVKSEVND